MYYKKWDIISVNSGISTNLKVLMIMKFFTKIK